MELNDSPVKAPSSEPAEALRSEWLNLVAKNDKELDPAQEQSAPRDGKDDNELKFDYTPVGRRLVLVSITLPDGGKVSRKTEALDGRDGQDGGMRVLKGYELPSGVLLEKSIQRNSDGSISLFDIDNENRKPNRHEIRMSPAEFIKFVKEYKKD